MKKTTINISLWFKTNENFRVLSLQFISHSISFCSDDVFLAIQLPNAYNSRQSAADRLTADCHCPIFSAPSKKCVALHAPQIHVDCLDYFVRIFHQTNIDHLVWLYDYKNIQIEEKPFNWLGVWDQIITHKCFIDHYKTSNYSILILKQSGAQNTCVQ